MVTLILKVIQRSPYSAFETVEVYKPLVGNVSLLEVTGATCKGSLPDDWEPLQDSVIFVVQDELTKHYIHRDDSAYLMNGDGKTLKVIHRAS